MIVHGIPHQTEKGEFKLGVQCSSERNSIPDAPWRFRFGVMMAELDEHFHGSYGCMKECKSAEDRRYGQDDSTATSCQVIIKFNPHNLRKGESLVDRIKNLVTVWWREAVKLDTVNEVDDIKKLTTKIIYMHYPEDHNNIMMMSKYAQFSVTQHDPIPNNCSTNTGLASSSDRHFQYRYKKESFPNTIIYLTEDEMRSAYNKRRSTCCPIS